MHMLGYIYMNVKYYAFNSITLLLMKSVKIKVTFNKELFDVPNDVS